MLRTGQTPSIQAPETISGTSLHHVGFVVQHITEAAEGFVSTLRMRWNGKIFHDPVQTVRVTFLQYESPNMPMLELVEPESQQSRVAAFLRHGGGLHHLCYEVDSLGTHLDAVVANGAILLRDRTPAVAFENREIAWVCTRERLLVEYLERTHRSQGLPIAVPTVPPGCL
jgi:methylmalonyl-CoA/ethylmalonyl-CoA epimerase